MCTYMYMCCVCLCTMYVHVYMYMYIPLVSLSMTNWYSLHTCESTPKCHFYVLLSVQMWVCWQILCMYMYTVKSPHNMQWEHMYMYMYMQGTKLANTFHPLKRGHLSNEDTSAWYQVNKEHTFHPLKRGHLSNEDTSARSQVNSFDHNCLKTL